MEIENVDVDALTTDQLLEMHEQLEKSGEIGHAGGESTEQATEAAEQKPAADSTNGQESQDDSGEADAAGVATKDGKHVIPYTVLQGERERARRAEQLLQQAEQRARELEAQLTSGQQANSGEGATTDPDTYGDDIDADDLAALEEDFPTVARAVKAAMKRAEQLAQSINPVQQRFQQQEQESQDKQRNEVQDAIDAVPKLAHIQANDKDAYEMAVQFDMMLRNRPEWTDKPMAERFQKVIEMVESSGITIDMPGGASLKEAAQAKAAQSAKAAAKVPVSLSDIPSGEAPAVNEHEAIEQMTPLQLAEKFAGMTPDQMEAYLSKI